jgi:hypothetical protein
MSSKWQTEPKIWRFRVRGKSGDGKVVTLGSYETEEEARADYEKLVKEAYYRNIKIETVTPPPPAPVEKTS